MINFISFIYFVALKRTATAEEGTVAVEQAWSELASLEQEQERARAERAAAERELEIVRQRGAALEDVRICFQPRKKSTMSSLIICIFIGTPIKDKQRRGKGTFGIGLPRSRTSSRQVGTAR